MAYFRSGTGGGGGGSETETTLWTNPSPASAFSAQTITLSNAYTNYKRLRFYFRKSTSDSTEYFVEYTKEEIGKWWDGSTSTTFSPVGGMPYYRSGSNYASRVIRRAGASVTNQFWISAAYNMNSSGTGTAYGIPTKITGIN